MNLSTPIEKIPNIGLTYQKRLKKLGIKTVHDLLFHFPHRYEDFSNIVKISELKLNETSCLQGKILEIENTKTWKKRMILTQAIVEDNSEAIRVVWFNQPYLIKVLKPGDLVCLAGKVLLGEGGLYLSNPAYEKISQTTHLPAPQAQASGGKANYKLQAANLIHAGRIVPVYPETEGLSSRWLRWILKLLLIKFSAYARRKTSYGGSAVAFGEGGKNKILDPLPEEIRNQHQLLPIEEAIWQIHFPDSLNLAKKAQERFSFQELFFIELLVLSERQRLAKEKAVPILLNLDFLQDFTKSLPFKLTDSQKKAAWQILKDLEKPRPMNRLLEGDVGSGKTVVATMAALNVTKGGFQVALMAPTEILAKQHFQEVSKLLKNFNLNIGLLTGKEDKIISKKLKGEVIELSRKKILEKVAKGEVDILIGTHALISAGDREDRVNRAHKKLCAPVKFKKLALVILDEQHRFGVEQRAKLIQTSNSPRTKVKLGMGQGLQPLPTPHLLSMTATPIPRTLALTIYGDLDLSLITELPKGRKKIITEVVAPENRKKAYQFIKKQVKKGRQVFVICPRIEPPTTFQGNKSDQTDYTKSGGGLSWAEVKAVKEEYEKLSKIVFPDLKVEMLHGKMATKEKERIMKDFKNKKIDILVSTSVIEVGIDVPNATLMMIEGAERFGLAQLHQFRGRVGRSKYQSFCFLFTDSPAKKTAQRLRALLKSEDGFQLAEKDLEIRGPGDLTGVRQWGIPDLAMASLKNVFLVEKTRQAAKEILEKDPELKKYSLLKERLEEFRKRIHLE